MSYYDIYRIELPSEYKIAEASDYREMLLIMRSSIRSYPLSTFKAYGPEWDGATSSRWFRHDELIKACLEQKLITEIELMERAL